MTPRTILELRRFRGWLAWCFICKTPIDPMIFGGVPLGWAGLYAHWDWDRSNWLGGDAGSPPMTPRPWSHWLPLIATCLSVFAMLVLLPWCTVEYFGR